jgi:hypothetical protein
MKGIPTTGNNVVNLQFIVMLTTLPRTINMREKAALLAVTLFEPFFSAHP